MDLHVAVFLYWTLVLVKRLVVSCAIFDVSHDMSPLIYYPKGFPMIDPTHQQFCAFQPLSLLWRLARYNLVGNI